MSQNLTLLISFLEGQSTQKLKKNKAARLCIASFWGDFPSTKALKSWLEKKSVGKEVLFSGDRE